MFSTLMTGVGHARGAVRLSAGGRLTGVAAGLCPAPDARIGGMRRGITNGFFAAAMLLVSSTCYAHSWYPHDCCRDGDCRPVPCDELVETRNGIMWRGVVLFNDAQVKASQDQYCHVCAKKQTGTVLPYLPLCPFIQPSS